MNNTPSYQQTEYKRYSESILVKIESIHDPMEFRLTWECFLRQEEYNKKIKNKKVLVTDISY